MENELESVKNSDKKVTTVAKTAKAMDGMVHGYRTVAKELNQHTKTLTRQWDEKIREFKEQCKQQESEMKRRHDAELKQAQDNVQRAIAGDQLARIATKQKQSDVLHAMQKVPQRSPRSMQQLQEANMAELMTLFSRHMEERAALADHLGKQEDLLMASRRRSLNTLQRQAQDALHHTFSRFPPLIEPSHDSGDPTAFADSTQNSRLPEASPLVLPGLAGPGGIMRSQSTEPDMSGGGSSADFGRSASVEPHMMNGQGGGAQPMGYTQTLGPSGFNTMSSYGTQHVDINTFFTELPEDNPTAHVPLSHLHFQGPSATISSLPHASSDHFMATRHSDLLANTTHYEASPSAKQPQQYTDAHLAVQAEVQRNLQHNAIREPVQPKFSTRAAATVDGAARWAKQKAWDSSFVQIAGENELDQFTNLRACLRKSPYKHMLDAPAAHASPGRKKAVPKSAQPRKRLSSAARQREDLALSERQVKRDNWAVHPSHSATDGNTSSRPSPTAGSRSPMATGGQRQVRSGTSRSSPGRKQKATAGCGREQTLLSPPPGARATSKQKTRLQDIKTDSATLRQQVKVTPDDVAQIPVGSLEAWIEEKIANVLNKKGADTSPTRLSTSSRMGTALDGGGAGGGKPLPTMPDHDEYVDGGDANATDLAVDALLNRLKGVVSGERRDQQPPPPSGFAAIVSHGHQQPAPQKQPDRRVSYIQQTVQDEPPPPPTTYAMQGLQAVPVQQELLPVAEAPSQPEYTEEPEFYSGGHVPMEAPRETSFPPSNKPPADTDNDSQAHSQLDEWVNGKAVSEDDVTSEVGSLPDIDDALPESEWMTIFTRIRHNKVATVETMLKRGVPVDIRDNFGNTPLHTACQNGHKRLAKMFIKKGADVNAFNHKGNTAMHFAYQYGYPSLFKYLVAKGADDKVANSSGNTCYEGL